MRMLVGEELYESMCNLPPYDKTIVDATKGDRLVALNTLYKVFVPTMENAQNVYSTLALMLGQSIERKRDRSFLGVNSGMSQVIWGPAGVGKSSLIQKSIRVIGNEPIKVESDFADFDVVPFVYAEVPMDASIKSLLRIILEQIDDKLGTKYMEQASSPKYTANQLEQLTIKACQFVGCVVVEELQNVVNFRAGSTLINFLVSLSNSGCSVVMVGVDLELEEFLTSKSHLARRTMPIQVERFDLNSEFQELVSVLFSYQFTKGQEERIKSYPMLVWLHEHSAGLPSLLVELFFRANKYAITNTDILDMDAFEYAFSSMKTMQDYVEVQKKKVVRSKPKGKKMDIRKWEAIQDFDYVGIVQRCRKDKTLDIITLLKEKEVEVVQI